MIQTHDVNNDYYNSKYFLRIFSYLTGYPVTCLKFYANKDDTKADHQKMLAATCM
jgi:hypothetical protein